MNNIQAPPAVQGLAETNVTRHSLLSIQNGCVTVELPSRRSSVPVQLRMNIQDSLNQTELQFSFFFFLPF